MAEYWPEGPEPPGDSSWDESVAVVLVADHTAYDVGQLVLTRRLLGIWS